MPARLHINLMPSSANDRVLVVVYHIYRMTEKEWVNIKQYSVKDKPHLFFVRFYYIFYWRGIQNEHSMSEEVGCTHKQLCPLL